MDLLGYFRMLRRRWALILALTVVGSALGVGSAVLSDSSSSSPSRTYHKATTTLVLDTTYQGEGGFQSGFQSLDQIAILTTTGSVPAEAAKKLGADEQRITEHIVTTVNGNAGTIDITAAEPTASEAVAVADTFATELAAGLTQRDTERYNAQVNYINTRISNLSNQVNNLTNQLAANPADKVVLAQLNTATNSLATAYADFGNLTAAGPPTARLSVLQKAQSVPIGKGEYDSRLALGALGKNHLTANAAEQSAITTGSDNTALNGKAARGIFGGLIGFLVGIGLAILLERLNRRIRNHEDAENAFGLPVLAEVPRISRSEQNEIVAAVAPLSRASEAFRAVRSSLLFARATMIDQQTAAGLHRDGDTKLFEPDRTEPLVIMVSSASPSEGKTTTAANLAAVFAESGASVLVVNCDFRRPSIHRFFGVDDEPRRVHETRVPGVKIITNVLSDPAANPSQVVAAQRQVVAAARNRFDVILLDTAPLLTANDAVEVVGSADLVVLVARSEETTFDNARRAADLLARLDAPLAGVVLSGVKDTANDYYYYYQPGRAEGGKGSGVNGNGAAVGARASSRGSGSDELFGAESSAGADAAPPD